MNNDIRDDMTPVQIAAVNRDDLVDNLVDEPEEIMGLQGSANTASAVHSRFGRGDAMRSDLSAAPGQTKPKGRLLMRGAMGLMAVLSAVAGYQLLTAQPQQRLEADIAAEPAPSALALVVEHAAVPGAHSSGMSQSVTAPDLAASAAAGAAQPASAGIQAAALAAAPAASSAVPGETSAALQARLAAVEARLESLAVALQEQGYLKPGARLDVLTSDGLMPYPMAAAANAARGAVRAVPAAGVVRVAQPAVRPAARPRRMIVEKASVSPGEAAPSVATPVVGVQLMAVDLWNGTPSVVVGTTTPGDTRLKVMQPGDVINGVLLKRAESDTQRATFAVRGGHETVLTVQAR